IKQFFQILLRIFRWPKGYQMKKKAILIFLPEQNTRINQLFLELKVKTGESICISSENPAPVNLRLSQILPFRICGISVGFVLLIRMEIFLTIFLTLCRHFE